MDAAPRRTYEGDGVTRREGQQHADDAMKEDAAWLASLDAPSASPQPVATGEMSRVPTTRKTQTRAIAAAPL